MILAGFLAGDTNNGRVTHVIEAARDITDLFQMQEDLTRNKTRLKTILKAVPTGIAIVRGRVFRWASPRLLIMTGYNAKELYGRKLKLFYDRPSESLEIEREAVRQLRTLDVATVNTRWRCKDGRTMDVHLRIAPLSSKNFRQGAILTVLDVTRQKIMECKFKNLAQAIEHTSEIVVVTDNSGKITYINPAFEKVTGYQRREVIGQNPRLLKSGEHSNFFYKRMWKTISGGKTWQGRIINRKKDGSRYTEEATISPVFSGSDKIVSYVAVKRDISNDLKIERQLRQAQKMEAIGTLAGGIAHDFNNILSPILGYAEMMMDDLSSDSPYRDNVEQILNAGYRAKDLVNQILTFSRQREHGFKPLKVALVVREALRLLRSTLPSTIEVRQDIDNNCGMIMADPTQIHQVVMNLCTNAYHAMQDSGGRLEITLKAVSLGFEALKEPSISPGKYACLTVTDTGMGMEAGTLNRIFDPYFTTKDSNKGTGLGLAVVHGIVKSCKGGIQVYSEPDKGSRFHVYFPIIEANTRSGETEPTKAVQGGSEEILLVEDEMAIVQMQKQMLARLGYRVTARTSSIEALEVFRKRPEKFDLVITDMTMPNMTGDKLAIELLRIRSDIPIILCTGFSEQMSMEKSKALGIAGFLMKPATPVDMDYVIRRALRRKNLDPMDVR